MHGPRGKAGKTLEYPMKLIKIAPHVNTDTFLATKSIMKLTIALAFLFSAVDYLKCLFKEVIKEVAANDRRRLIVVYTTLTREKAAVARGLITKIHVYVFCSQYFLSILAWKSFCGYAIVKTMEVCCLEDTIIL